MRWGRGEEVGPGFLGGGEVRVGDADAAEAVDTVYRDRLRDLIDTGTGNQGSKGG